MKLTIPRAGDIWKLTTSSDLWRLKFTTDIFDSKYIDSKFNENITKFVYKESFQTLFNYWIRL